MHLALTVVLGLVALGLALSLAIMWSRWPTDDSDEIAELKRERDVERAKLEAQATELAELRSERSAAGQRLRDALADVKSAVESMRGEAERRSARLEEELSATSARAGALQAAAEERDQARAERDRLQGELASLRELYATVTQQLCELERRDHDYGELRLAYDRQGRELLDKSERLARLEAQRAGLSWRPSLHAPLPLEAAGPGPAEGSSRSDAQSEAAGDGEAQRTTSVPPEAPHAERESAGLPEGVMAGLRDALAAVVYDRNDAPLTPSMRGSLMVVSDDLDALTVIPDLHDAPPPSGEPEPRHASAPAPVGAERLAIPSFDLGEEPAPPEEPAPLEESAPPEESAAPEENAPLGELGLRDELGLAAPLVARAEPASVPRASEAGHDEAEHDALPRAREPDNDPAPEDDVPRARRAISFPDDLL